MKEDGGYCVSCPDRQACSTGWPCFVVRQAIERAAERASKRAAEPPTDQVAP